MQQRRRGRELAAGFDACLRRDIAPIEHDLPVAAALDDARHAEQRVAVVGIALAQQLQAQGACLHRFRVVSGIRVVAQIQVDDVVAGHRIATAVAEVDLVGAGACARRREEDHFAQQVGGNLERARQRVDVGHRERCAVGQHATRAHERHAAQRELRFVQHQFAKAPGIRMRGACTSVDQGLDEARLLLKMVRSQEHALRPDHAVMRRHRYAACERTQRETVADTESGSARIVMLCVRPGCTAVIERHVACSRFR